MSVDELSEAPQTHGMSMVERFASNLRRARLAQGLTQEGLAEACDLHRTHISLLEQAKRDPKMTTIAKLAHGLQTTPAALMRGVTVTQQS